MVLGRSKRIFEPVNYPRTPATNRIDISRKGLNCYALRSELRKEPVCKILSLENKELWNG